MKSVWTMLGPLFAVLLFAGGCRSAQAPARPDRMWQPPDPPDVTVSNDAVWRVIEHESAAPAAPLALADLFQIALRNSPSVRQAWAQAQAAEAQVRQAQSQYYPQATATGTATAQKTDQNQETLGGELRDNNYQPQLELTWLLLDLGGRGAQVEQARQSLIALNFSFNQKLQELVLNTATAYVNLFSAQAAVAAAEASLTNAQISLESAQQRLDAGLATRLDVLQAQSGLDKALYTLADADGQVRTAHANLAQTIGLAADTPFEIHLPGTNQPVIPQEDVSAMIRQALDQRPDIAAARANIRAREAAVRAANSDLWPSLNLGANAEKTWHHYSGAAQADSLQADDYVYAGYLALEWKFFDGFFNLAAKRKAQAQLDEERARLKAAELAASANVWNSYYNLNTALKKRASALAYLDSSEEAYAFALQGYEAGLKSVLDLLKAQSDLADARSKRVDAEREVYVALANLAYALGTIHEQPIVAQIMHTEEPTTNPP